MKRHSARHGLSTVSELNVTPLLDLAFVLLIIFMITTTAVIQGIEINIPKRTYVSVPMQIIHAGAKPTFRNEDWSGVYQLAPLPIWTTSVVPGEIVSTPAAWMELTCRKASPEPSDSSTKPNPFSGLNHFTTASWGSPTLAGVIGLTGRDWGRAGGL